MSTADNILRNIEDDLDGDPAAITQARDRLASIRDGAVRYLDYQLQQPGPFYDAAERWGRQVARFQFADDEMELAEILIRCAQWRKTAGDIIQAKLDMAEALMIFEIHANSGVLRAINSLAQITSVFAKRDLSRGEEEDWLALVEPAGRC